MAERILAGVLTAIHHIGSTAVPALVAKPTIDILLETALSAGVAANRRSDSWRSEIFCASIMVLLSNTNTRQQKTAGKTRRLMTG